MHLNLLCFDKELRGRLSTIPSMPTSTNIWDHSCDPNTPSRSSLCGVPQNSEAYSPNETLQTLFDFCTEINLQQELTGHATSATDVRRTYDDDSPRIEGTANSSHGPGSSSDKLFPDNGLGSQSINGPLCRVKYHMYEVSIYWPVIYRIILDGIANTEFLPYGPLFFESVTGFLGAAKIAIGACLPKAWFLCARFVFAVPFYVWKLGLPIGTSIYTISLAAVRALEVRCLRLLAEPQLWESLETSVEALHAPSELSPSIRHMHGSLKDRLEMAKDQKRC